MSTIDTLRAEYQAAFDTRNAAWDALRATDAAPGTPEHRKVWDALVGADAVLEHVSNRYTQAQMTRHADPAPTHAAIVADDVLLVRIDTPGEWHHVRALEPCDLEPDELLAVHRYERVGPWELITQHDAYEYSLAPVQAVQR